MYTVCAQHVWIRSYVLLFKVRFVIVCVHPGSLRSLPFNPICPPQKSSYCTMAPPVQDEFRLPRKCPAAPLRCHYLDGPQGIQVWRLCENQASWTENAFLSRHDVSCSLDIHEETSTVQLNSNGLDLGPASIFSEFSKSEQSQSGQTVDEDLQRVTFSFPNALPAGSKAQLRVAFNGPLRSTMTGYYIATWEGTKHYALTQFEPIDARAVFPCWDEPLLKATFNITMVSHADTVNLSNMPAISEEIYTPGSSTSNQSPEMGKILTSLPTEHKWKITRFETTPPMSTYIVAFANGHFAHREQKVVMPLSGKTVPLRIYSTPDVIHQADFALDVAAQVLPIYEKVFDVEYPLPKLDTLVASDFDAGAMENWGLITGRTTSLLLDPAKADVHAKKYVAVTQSHEVAHMWFGNITTMKWWDNLYLNEGFATLLDGRSHHPSPFSDKIFPEWKANSEFISDHLQSALALDAKLSSHPIEVPCPNADHINQIFDALSYSKAASVLRMLCDYVGEEKFLKGVSLYLKKNLYGNTVTNDLFEGISTATGIDTVRIMDNWIKQQGFPVLTVTENANGIHVRQDRFIETGQVDPKENETIWNVPLSLVTADPDGQVKIDKLVILEEREKDIALDTNMPYKLNGGTTGVYRVLYPPARLAKIAAEASKENSIFSLDDRMGILYDVNALSKAGLAKLSDTLTVIDLWSNEKEYLVLSTVAETLNALISTFWESPEIVEPLRAFVRSLFVPIVNRLGYEYKANESLDITQLRTLAISMASSTGNDQGVVDELRSRFAHYMTTGNDSKIPADLQTAIFNAAVKYGGHAEYEAIVKIQENPKTPTARLAAIRAMGIAQDPAVLDRTFSYIFKLRDQDIMYSFRGLQQNIHARRRLATFFQDNYDALMKRFEGNFTVKNLVSISYGALSTKKDVESIEEFFKDKDTSKYHLALAQVLETIRTRIAYIERSFDDLNDWLRKWEKRSKL
ncbi:Aminopeptidase 1 [Mycena sanguinolenta]|uniref:Aminopeptidase n=1 Tax=Mycena sanguinolenta TaxID=230812 RepID=A0A8H7D937_9AGAR|nr:Aminopeptidase 1 [Mycena sanguinolenta]